MTHDIFNVLISNDCSKMLSCAKNDAVVVWDLNTNRELARYDEKNVMSFDASGDFSTFVVGRRDGSAGMFMLKDVTKS